MSYKLKLGIEELINSYQSHLNNSKNRLNNLNDLDDWNQLYDFEEDYKSDICYSECEVGLTEGFIRHLVEFQKIVEEDYTNTINKISV